MLIGYARVSKSLGQDPAMQVQALRAAGAERVFVEQASGGRWDRPELHHLLDTLRAGDVLVVWKLDRLSRSLRDLLTLLDRLQALEVGFRSLTEQIDTTTPAGRMMLQMLGAFAEFEREMTRERTREGLAAARAEGRIGGRKPKLSADAARRAGALRAGGALLDGAGGPPLRGPPGYRQPPDADPGLLNENSPDDGRGLLQVSENRRLT